MGGRTWLSQNIDRVAPTGAAAAGTVGPQHLSPEPGLTTHA